LAAVVEGSADLAAARPAVVARAEAGKERIMALDSKNYLDSKHYEALLSEFVAKLRSAAQQNLVSVILYGSAAEGEFHAEYSDLNLLCIVRDTSFTSLSRVADAVEWWRKKKHHPPLVLTAKELKDTADVFSIEFIDMKQRYRVLYGEDPLRDLVVPMHCHRQQLEYELREKLFLLRQHLLLAGTDEKGLWEVMLNSLSSFTTLVRHVLIELGEQGRRHSREATQELATRLNFDPSAFVQLIDVRARKLDRKQLAAPDVAARYLSAIEKVASAVDTMQSSPRERPE
jgi:predicted nucleotidyltransferase